MSEIYEVIIPANIKRDMREIIAFYSLENKEYALKIFDNLMSRIFSLKNYPEKGRLVPELERQNITDYRELIESWWRIMYKIEGQQVIITALIDGRRNVEDILLKKLQSERRRRGERR